MRFRTDKQLRTALAIVVMRGSTKKIRDSGVANIMLGELDNTITDCWLHLSDMGISKVEFMAIKCIVKKRL
jgi:hypothetical protein